MAIPLAWTTLKSPVTETPMVSGAPPGDLRHQLIDVLALGGRLHLHFQAGVLLGEQIGVALVGLPERVPVP